MAHTSLESGVTVFLVGAFLAGAFFGLVAKSSSSLLAWCTAHVRTPHIDERHVVSIHLCVTGSRPAPWAWACWRPCCCHPTCRTFLPIAWPHPPQVTHVAAGIWLPSHCLAAADTALCRRWSAPLCQRHSRRVPSFVPGGSLPCPLSRRLQRVAKEGEGLSRGCSNTAHSESGTRKLHDAFCPQLWVRGRGVGNGGNNVRFIEGGGHHSLSRSVVASGRRRVGALVGVRSARKRGPTASGGLWPLVRKPAGRSNSAI